MAKKLTNPVDISEDNCKILFSYWENIYNQENSPSDFFAILPPELINDFEEKLKSHCEQILTKAYKNWAFGRYRIDLRNNDGIKALTSDVFAYLLTSSENDKFVNLKEIFKHGEKQINKNLNRMIKQVIAGYRYRTVIDTLLRRIEKIADDNANKITRNRTDRYGPKADYFTLVNKFPEERDPTRDEVEKVISLVGRFKVTPFKNNAKQASRIYTTQQLIDMMEIISNTLPTDVTPNTLERIFIDLIPDFLPSEFLREKVYKIEGDRKIVDALLLHDTQEITAFNDLEPDEQLEVKELVKEAIDTVVKEKLTYQFNTLMNHMRATGKDLKLKELEVYEEFSDIHEIKETWNLYNQVFNRINSTASSGEVSQIAYLFFMDAI